MAEPGLDFGAASQANGSLNLPAFWEMELGWKRKFPPGAKAGFGPG